MVALISSILKRTVLLRFSPFACTQPGPTFPQNSRQVMVITLQVFSYVCTRVDLGWMLGTLTPVQLLVPWYLSCSCLMQAQLKVMWWALPTGMAFTLSFCLLFLHVDGSLTLPAAHPSSGFQNGCQACTGGKQYEAMTRRQNDVNLISSVYYICFNIPRKTP